LLLIHLGAVATTVHKFPHTWLSSLATAIIEMANLIYQYFFLVQKKKDLYVLVFQYKHRPERRHHLRQHCY
jgi:hypothetical protein